MKVIKLVKGVVRYFRYVFLFKSREGRWMKIREGIFVFGFRRFEFKCLGLI